jgi:23S rRNA pseudouridine2605 synthase
MAKKTEPVAGRSPKKTASAPVKSSKAPKPRIPKEDASAKSKSEPAIAKSAPAKSKSAPAKSKAKPDPKAAAKTKTAVKSEIKSQAKPAAAKPRKTKSKAETVPPPAPAIDLSAPIADPIGDLSDGEAHHSTIDSRPEPESLAQMAAYRADTDDEALDGTPELAPEEFSSAIESAYAGSEARQGRRQDQPDDQRDDQRGEHDGEPVKLDRLQKILSQAGIASRRHAEEMILAGRIMVNGQVITQLGAKADPARDHIKVDGKLIPAAEHHRYFMLNKPRGFVTTVSDPEGRPTVMQFFAKMRERLYPVGRLDYESEGLLLVTNDGELANQLTRAASGVEKTYLVKVAGRPTQEELEQLRSGVLIERGEPGSDKTQTAPARISEFHTGARPGGAKPGRAGSHAGPENPWYEVVLIEGRNRELRKMFQSVGHFVEKIRRVGYGPLILDVEPGQLRELTPQELTQLRRTAEGKAKPAEKSGRFEASGAPRSDAGRPPEPGAGRRFDARVVGRPTRFPDRPFRDRRESRGSSDRPAPSRFGPARPFPSKEQAPGDRGETQFRKFDSDRRPPGSGPRDPRPESRPAPRLETGFDPRRSERPSGPNRGFGRVPDRGPSRNVARGPGQGFSRGPKPPFGAPRNDFDRQGAATENEFSNRPPNRPGPKRGQFDRSGPARSGPDRFGAKRPDAQRGASKPFGARPNFAARGDAGSRPRFDSGSRPNPASRPGFKPKFDRGPSSFRPHPNPRPNLDIRPAPRSENSGFDSPREASNPRRPSRPYSGPRVPGQPPRGDSRSKPPFKTARFDANPDRTPGGNPGGKFDAPGERPSRPAWKKSPPRFSPKSSHGSSPARGAGPAARGGRPKRNPPRPGGPRPGGPRTSGRKPGGPRPGGRKRG